MNKVILMGRLTRDPDVRYKTEADGTTKANARYTLAVDRRIKTEGQQNADFISCVCFNKSAEFVEKYCKQGTKLIVEGEIRTGSYANRDGQKVYTTDIFVSNQEFAESKATADSNGTSRNNTAAADDNGFMNIPDGVEDEGLPFN